MHYLWERYFTTLQLSSYIRQKGANSTSVQVPQPLYLSAYVDSDNVLNTCKHRAPRRGMRAECR